jgi:hypothetical protein
MSNFGSRHDRQTNIRSGTNIQHLQYQSLATDTNVVRIIHVLPYTYPSTIQFNIILQFLIYQTIACQSEYFALSVYFVTVH